MEPDMSVMLIWSMAAAEAQATGWYEIEPFHLICAALKFAELESADLDKIGDAAGHRDVIRNSHQRLRNILTDPWEIEVPGTSTPFRRALRRSGEGNSSSNHKGILHRSDTARTAFRNAQSLAKDDGRTEFDMSDLTHAILADPNDWILRAMGKFNIPCGDELKERRQFLVEFSDILEQIEPNGLLDMAEQKRISTDPTVRVLMDHIYSGKRPVLLIHGGDHSASEVVEDLARLSKYKSSKVRIARINSRALLNRIAEDKFFSVSNLLMYLTDRSSQGMVYFFDMIHRYLSESISNQRFVSQFRTWLARTDNRFVFALPKSQYDNLKDQEDWDKRFQIIWIHGDPAGSIAEL